MSIICDSEWCEYNEDGYCEKEKVKIIDMSCASNRYKESENNDK